MKKMFILVLALVMAFAALPAFAQDKADWAFYGSVRMWTAWEGVDDNTPPQLSNSGFFPVASSAAVARTIPGNRNAASAPGDDPGLVPTSVTDDDEMSYLLQSNSRIGANVKWGNVGGRFEYGHSSTANLRLLYGTWNFGAGTLLLGQDYGPYFYLISGLCGPGGAECNGIGFGSIYTGRTPQIKLIFGGLQVAIERPEVQQSFTFSYPSGNNNITRLFQALQHPTLLGLQLLILIDNSPRRSWRNRHRPDSPEAGCKLHLQPRPCPAFRGRYLQQLHPALHRCRC